MDFYDVIYDYSSIATAIPPPFNVCIYFQLAACVLQRCAVWATMDDSKNPGGNRDTYVSIQVLGFVLELGNFCRHQLLGTFDLIYPNVSLRERLFKYLSCNATEMRERLQVAKGQENQRALHSVERSVYWWKQVAAHSLRRSSRN